MTTDQRRTPWLWIVIALMVAAGLATAGLYLLGDSPEDERMKVRRSVPNARAAPGKDTGMQGMENP